MTELRDARLKRALEHAPDAHMAPDARTRAAIRAMAIQAAAPAAVPGQALPWWRRLMGAPGSSSSRMPWNAAFATVLLASLVTLIWRDEEIPGATSADPPMASSTKESAAKAVTPEAAPAQPARPGLAPSAPPPASISAPVPAPEAPQPAESRRAAEPRADALAKKSEPATAEAQGKAAAAAPESVQRERQGTALRDEPAAAQAVPRPVPEPAPLTASPPAPASPPPAARMAPPAPAAPAAAMPRQREAQSMGETTRAAGASAGGSIAADAGRANFVATDEAVFRNWTQARIISQGRATLVSRGQAEALAGLVRELALAVSGRDGATGPVELQIELIEGGVVTGTLAVGPSTARWTRTRGGIEQASSGTVEPARVRQLVDEAARLVSR